MIEADLFGTKCRRPERYHWKRRRRKAADTPTRQRRAVFMKRDTRSWSLSVLLAGERATQLKPYFSHLIANNSGAGFDAAHFR